MSARQDRGNKVEWLAYYSRKRIIHQWTQLNLLGATDGRTVLEIGPALGFVTSLLVNSGYEVTTLDLTPRSFRYPDVPHLEKDICELRSEEIAGFDAILCCEVLEHIEWHRVASVLAAFRDSGAKFLIVSVPYMGFQVFVELYLNGRTLRQYFSMKKLLWRKQFQPEPAGGHQWEVGYRGYPLRLWEKRLSDSGWSVVKRDFTEHCRSVFHLLKAR
ncbi:MAG: class I SAM-dependent methyltransferase [Alphaproteobacteria bacterium]|nr:class I SAM-dependent methyltransferase [Alphaproteobacteria bacterium]MBV9376286.1 class I SAM-dependent methyltransferase [Alphaproteobacteria bacterium]